MAVVLKRHFIEFKYYSHNFHTTIAESIHTTPNYIQCPFNMAGYLIRGEARMAYN